MRPSPVYDTVFAAVFLVLTCLAVLRYWPGTAAVAGIMTGCFTVLAVNSWRRR
jgi:hypothetical protein